MIIIIIIVLVLLLCSLLNKDDKPRKHSETQTLKSSESDTPYNTSSKTESYNNSSDTINKPKQVVTKQPFVSSINTTSVISSNIELPKYTPQYIEQGTDYSSWINRRYSIDFSDVRKYAKDYLRGDSVPLDERGVAPLTSIKELCQYMFSYGNMHFAKLESAFSCLPNSIFNEKVEIIDWGCGQGVATIVLLQLKKPKKVAFTLIEPGKLALKRAVLNVKMFHSKFSSGFFSCRSVNKSFDNLFAYDISTSNNIKMHLFSNTLDIVDRYNQNNLINLIKKSQTGKNYFICVSPYQDDRRKRKIDNFVNSFRSCNNFKLHLSVDNSKDDDYWECNKTFMGINCNSNCDDCSSKWTRIIRVFSIDL